MKWFENIRELIEPNPGDFGKPLFRIIPFDALLQLLNERKNTLVQTSKWEDSYENFMLKEHLINKGKTYSLEEMTKQWFGQCWTTKQSSDALWRIYSPDKKSVRIKTTIGQLWGSASNYHGKGKFLIGRVQYFPQSRINAELEQGSPYTVDEIGEIVINSFFVKRNSFSHESEYRLIYMCDKGSDDIGKDIIQFDVDPQQFIVNVYFDPRADKAYVERCKRILVNAFDYPSKRIHMSTLYYFKPSAIEVL